MAVAGLAAAASPAEGSLRREQPWLLPENHRVRNLVSVCIRNLSLSSPAVSRRRGKTNDDEALPNTLQTPTKRHALREQKLLQQSRSSTDLRSVTEDDADERGDAATSTADDVNVRREMGSPTKRTPTRPSIRKVRRRSTLEWNNASPQKRQERLERETVHRMADVFYTLHASGIEEPIYCSETVECSTNPTFRTIDWSHCGPGITRLDRLTVRFWACKSTSQSWRLLTELQMRLPALQYLGRTLDKYERPLPQNCIVFEFLDGVYTAFDALPAYSPSTVHMEESSRPATSRTLPTSSFDVLLRLAKLDESIQDAMMTRNRLAADLEQIVQANSRSFTSRDQVADANDRLKTVEFAKSVVAKQSEKARVQVEQKRTALTARRTFMTTDRESQDAARHVMQEAQSDISDSRTQHESLESAKSNQRRRICEELQGYFPIEAVPDRTLAFNICGIHLPNSDELDAEPPERVAAALGHVAHAVQLLSFYLGQPLPYPVTLKSSNSTVYDPLSLLKTNASVSSTYKDEHSLRTYPLFSKSVPRYRFEYAVFLLNKDIQILLETVYNVRVLDIRHTLPNLKYLLYVVTAGEGELPARKTGGIRGLLRLRRANDAPPQVHSREHSHDSIDSARSGLAWSLGPGRMSGRPKDDAIGRLKKSAGLNNGFVQK